VRRRENVYPRGECPPGFSREVDEHYRERVTGETLMVNELLPVRSISASARAWAKAARNEALVPKQTIRKNEAQEFRDSLDACAKLRSQLLASLDRYEPES